MTKRLITVYGANWCSDCRRTKKYLREQRIQYVWRDIESETKEGKAAYDFVSARFNRHPNEVKYLKYIADHLGIWSKNIIDLGYENSLSHLLHYSKE